MHEMSIVESLLTAVFAEAERHGARRVRRVKLRVGKLQQIIPDSLQFCYDIATQGTPAEGSQLDLEEVPITARCRRCGQVFEVEEFLFLCPACHVADVETCTGNELILETLELEVV